MDFGANFSLKTFNPLRNFWNIWKRPAENRIYFLDGLRAIAILWLICFHCIFFVGYFISPQNFREFVGNREILWFFTGHLGVDVFFVLSGFLIGSLLLREVKKTGTIRLKRFYFRRAFRILPAYFTVLGFLAIFVRHNLENVWANFFYVNNFLPITKQYMIWTWSLAIEEQFYLIIPLVLLLVFRLKKYRFLILFSLFALSFVIQYFLVVQHNLEPPMKFYPHFEFNNFDKFFNTFYDKTYARYGGLLLGVLAAYLNLFTPTIDFLKRKPLFSHTLLVVSLGLLLAFHFYPLIDTSIKKNFRFILSSYVNIYALAVTYVLLFCLAADKTRSILSRFLSNYLWYPLAQLSYSAFLLHPIVIFLFYQRIIHVDHIPSSKLLFGWTFICIILIFLAASILYSIIEKPMMDSRKT